MKKLVVVLAVLACVVSTITGAHAQVILDWTMAADPLTTWAGGTPLPGHNPTAAFTTLTVAYSGDSIHPGSWFTDYWAIPSLPQVDSDDLDSYAWAMSLSIVSASGRDATYIGEFFLYAPGYGYTPADYLEKADVYITATFNPSWTSAALSGYFVPEVGTQQPSGWPVPVDFSSVGIASIFEGTWSFQTTSPTDPPHVDGTDYVQARLKAVVPEPMSIMLGLMGLGSVAGLRKLRRK